MQAQRWEAQSLSKTSTFHTKLSKLILCNLLFYFFQLTNTYPHSLIKESRFTEFKIKKHPSNHACILLQAKLESSSNKLFGFYLKRPAARLSFKIFVAAKQYINDTVPEPTNPRDKGNSRYPEYSKSDPTRGTIHALIS